MKSLLFLIPLAVLCLPVGSQAQYVWTELSDNYDLPEGIKLFQGVRSAPTKRVYYIEVDMNNPDYIVHPYLTNSATTTSNFSANVGAIAAINGGFFGGSGSTASSVSALLEPGVLKARNDATVPRVVNNVPTNIPITRAFLGLNQDRSASIDWIYHYGNTPQDIFYFDNPTPNTPTFVAPTPVKSEGNAYDQLLMGIGGGPVLIKNGEIRVTYDEEGFYGGSGLDGNLTRMRSAVGYTEDGRLIMLVVESGTNVNGVFVSGLALIDLAQVMFNLGCVEAMNLDGGGSSTMVIGNELVHRTQGGLTTQRQVPTILAVVPSDSLKFTFPVPEIILDTEMENVIQTGDGWFATANAGFYGTSPSLLVPIGNGSQFMTYRPQLENTTYEVYGWWVADPNRSSNTPYRISSASGDSTVRVNQKQQNSQWVLLGEFEFTGTESDKVVISNDATNGLFVVADAIRFVKTGSDPVSINSKDAIPASIRLNQNYPNPFNPTTNIAVSIAQSTSVTIKVYDLTGRFLQTIYDGWLNTGNHVVQFDGRSLSSGSYVYVLESDGFRESRLMTLIK
jgi:hypothetical protein